MLTNPNFSPFVATLTGAFIGAIVSMISQMVSHRYSVRRENQKYNREVFQTLFSELYQDLLKTFIEYEHAKPLIKKYSSNEVIYQNFTLIKNISRVITMIKNNPKYVDPALLYFCYQSELTQEYALNRPNSPEERVQNNFEQTMNKQILLNLLIYIYKVHKHGGVINTAFNRQLKDFLLFLFWEFTKEDLKLPIHKKMKSILQFYQWKMKL
jgi:hypothetical protein